MAGRGPSASTRPGDSYALREFSQHLHDIVQGQLCSSDVLFPRAQRFHETLRAAGEIVDHKRVRRLMREAGITGIFRRREGRSRAATLAAKARQAGVAEDLVRRDFAVDGPDQRWYADTTEHPTDEVTLYLLPRQRAGRVRQADRGLEHLEGRGPHKPTPNRSNHTARQDSRLKARSWSRTNRACDPATAGPRAW